MNPDWVGLGAATVLIAFVMEMLRRGILREKFAALWLFVAASLVLGALFPGLLSAAARALGFQVTSNLLFFLAILFLLLVAVQLSYEISKLEARTRRLAEDLALLRSEVHDRPGAPTGDGPAASDG